MKSLTSELYENPDLGEALVETLLAFLGEDVRADQVEELNFFDLLQCIERQRIQAEKAQKPRLNAALNRLDGQLRHGLRRSALAIHEALREGYAPAQTDLQRVGFGVTDFPTGFPSTHLNLLATSEKCFEVTRELSTLQRYFPDQLPVITHKITIEQHAFARQIRDIAWEAFSTGLFTDKELLDFHHDCVQTFQRQRVAAQNALIAIFTQRNIVESPAKARKNLQAWLQQFGRPFWNILNTLLPTYRRRGLELLIGIPGYTGLEALLVMEPENDLQDVFDILMTIRFGQAFCEAAHDWRPWLKATLDTYTKREQALNFWKAHPYSILPVVIEWVQPSVPQDKASISRGEFLQGQGRESLTISETLKRKQGQETGETDVAEFLEQRRSLMPEEEIQVIQAFLDTRPPAVPEELPLEFETAPEQELPQEESLTPHLVKSVVDTAIEYTRTGNLLESAVVTALDKGAEAFGQQLTVTIEDEETTERAEREHPARLQAEEEPGESIWLAHVFPFITENWAPLLGGGMVLTGLLLLEFYIWDKAPWLRYGLSPVIIALVSFVLSMMGVRLQRDEGMSQTPIAIIQGISIFLAPMSLLFAAMFFVDSDLTLINRILWGLILSGVLLMAWSYIFVISIRVICRAMARLHGVTLLVLNALLLLLPVAQFSMLSNEAGLLGAKVIVIAGFYLGFLFLCWSMRRVLGKILEQGETTTGVPMIFYSVTSLGTYALVWGLTHARLQLLPRPYTYSPLLLLFSFLLLLMEFTLLDARRQTNRITSLSYTAYFFIGLGILLGVTHDYVRVAALLLAGLVWLYQAFKMNKTRHFNIALVLLTIGFSMIALIKNFPPLLIPYLGFGIALGIYGFALPPVLKARNSFVVRFSPLYLAFAFVVSVLWQWAARMPPLSYGVAFVLFGLFAIFLGAKTDRLIHVHIGAAYCVAALPYLGTVNMVSYTLRGNTLVFGLALVGFVWMLVSSLSPYPAIKDSRSTVLWNIGILAFCMMCLRLLSGDLIDASTDAWVQFQILNAPVVIAGLMFLVGYFTRSYPAVGLALAILVFVLPEIKSRLNVPSFFGLGEAASGLGLLTLTLIFRKLLFLFKPRETFDLIWRKKGFPFQAGNDYLLFAHPFMAAALLLFMKAIFLTYPQIWFQLKEPLPIYLPLAVLLAGTGIHFCGLWYDKSWFSYPGYVAILFGFGHLGYTRPPTLFSPILLPILLFLAFAYCEVFRRIVSRLLTAEKARLITAPFQLVRIIAVWLGALSFYLYYSLFYTTRFPITVFFYWIPLLLYLFALAGWRAWHARRPAYSRWFLLPAYLLLWQLVILTTNRGYPLPDILIASRFPFHLSTTLMVLGVVSAFFLLEWLLPEKIPPGPPLQKGGTVSAAPLRKGGGVPEQSQEKFYVLSPLLWMSLLFLVVYSGILMVWFYLAPEEFPHLTLQIALWTGVSLILGRYLNLGFLWLWAVWLGHLLILPSVESYVDFYGSLAPETLAVLTIALAGLAALTRRFVWVYHHRWSWSWRKLHGLSPWFLFALVSQWVVLVCFVQATVHSAYRHEWMTILGLFLATLPALLIAHEFGVSRYLLFSCPYTLAWIGLAFAMQNHFPENVWLSNLSASQIIACGLFGALGTLVISDTKLPGKDRPYRAIKYGIAVSVLVLVGVAYLTIRDITRLSWPWLVTSGLLALGAGVYFRYLIQDFIQPDVLK